jgi:hypothetical protein
MSEKKRKRKRQDKQNMNEKNPDRDETIREAMQSVELRKADGTVVKAAFDNSSTTEVEEDAQWYAAFVDPDEGDISIHSLGTTTGELWHPDNIKKKDQDGEETA